MQLKGRAIRGFPVPRLSSDLPQPQVKARQSLSKALPPLTRFFAPSPFPHLLTVVGIVAEAQATVIGDLRQVFVVKFFQAYVLGRPGEEAQVREPPTLDSPAGR